MQAGRFRPGDPAGAQPPQGSPVLEFGDDLGAVCGFVAAQAARHGVIGNQAALLVIAAGDVAAHLIRNGPARPPGGRASVRVWPQPEALLCRFHAPGAPDPVRAADRLRDLVEVVASGPDTTLRLPLS